MPSFTKKQQIAILIVSIVLIFLIGTRFSIDKESEAETSFKEIELEENESIDDKFDSKEEIIEENSEELVVYIKGAVKYPGILVVEQGSRVADLIEDAGGPDEGADFNSVNLARKVQDEEMIHIPYHGEEAVPIEKGNTEITVDAGNQESNAGIKININTASKEELKTLSGIGDVTADKIINHRESTGFKAIEDIMDVSGIGEKKFEAIKDSITVN